MQLIAHGLEVGHPAAYCLVFLLTIYPILGIVSWYVIDKISEWRKKK